MSTVQQREKEFELLLNRFSNFVKGQIQKFNVQKYGVDPDDVAQEVRIKLWKLVNGEKSIVNYASYIRKIVISSAIDQIRKLKRDEMIYQVERQKQISERDILYKPESLRDEALREIVGQAVESLMESRRNVVKLYLLNMSLEEITLYYGWSAHKTRNLLYRGLSDLKKVLKKTETNHEDQ